MEWLRGEWSIGPERNWPCFLAAFNRPRVPALPSHSARPRATPRSHSARPRATPRSHSARPRATPRSRSDPPRAPAPLRVATPRAPAPLREVTPIRPASPRHSAPTLDPSRQDQRPLLFGLVATFGDAEVGQGRGIEHFVAQRTTDKPGLKGFFLCRFTVRANA